MLSYRHHYHAGNFADVFKHAILIQLVHTLQRKERPLCLMETHAGAGRYDLNADPARKNAEHRQGILRFWKKGPIAPELADYLKIVSAFNTERGEPGLRWYPGSPRILRALLRPQDRLLLMEMHPADHRLLKDEFSGDRQVGVHQGDGYAALRALLPPRKHGAWYCWTRPTSGGTNSSDCSTVYCWPGNAGPLACWRPGIPF